ncbi:thiamine pyrophosphate-binding protein [Kribbella sp. NPDC056951]|uniref:thiamine pyrophosphate-binding protein n=1 Tax=Kribbella sp. NPDC056951 TaxID=3345978 RepID=UPI003633CA6F
MAEAVTGGAAVVDSLVAQGVRHVFGIPGTHNLEIYRYLPSSGIRHIVTRHEQGAGYAADGYARVTGGPGVLITTSGPGITNAITALATSYADSVPTLAISPGPPRGTVGKDIGWLHELKNQQGALDVVCDRSIRVENADELPEVIADIFAGFISRRPRPVHLEVPVDVLEGKWVRRTVAGPTAVEEAGFAAPSAVGVAGFAEPAASEVAAIGAAFAGARRPLLIAGGGARGAAAEIRALAANGVPVLTTVNGKGVIDESDPVALGASIRLPAAHRVIAEADLVVAVGTELGDSDLWGGVAQAAKVVRIDVDPDQLHKNLRADLAVVGDARRALQFTTQQFDTAHVSEWQKAIRADADRDAGPWAAIQDSLKAALPADTVVAGDSSQVTYYGTVHYWPFTTTNRLLYPTGYATLGYGLPAAIGAKVAQPERPVIGLFGDGAAMFTIQELVTATELRLPLPIVVVNNGGYAEIREQMVDRGITPQAVDLYQPDLPAMARAIGAYGVEAESAAVLGELAAQALTADRPTLIHLAIDGSTT